MSRHIFLSTLALLLSASLAFAQPPRGEGRQGGRPGGDRGGFRPPNPLLMIFDTDQDGELSADEIAKAAESLAKLDRNDDGKVTEDELPRPPRPPFGQGGPGGRGGRGGAGFAERLFQFDKNGDGKLSKDEMPEQFAERMMERLDTDGDGFVTKEEIAAMAERFQGGRRPGGEGRRGEGRRPGGERGDDGDREGRRPRRPDPDA